MTVDNDELCIIIAAEYFEPLRKSSYVFSIKDQSFFNVRRAVKDVAES